MEKFRRLERSNFLLNQNFKLTDIESWKMERKNGKQTKE